MSSATLCKHPSCRNPVYWSGKGRRKVYCDAPACIRDRATSRKRAERRGDLSESEFERLNAARRMRMVGEQAFAAPREHSLSYLWRFGLVEGDDPGEYVAITQFRYGADRLGGIAA
jgi:hypothetical protein